MAPCSTAGFFFPSQYLCDDLPDPVSDGTCGTGGFQEQGQCFYNWPKLLGPILSSTIFHFSSFFLYVGIVGLGSGLIGCKSLSPSLALPTIFNKNKNKIFTCKVSLLSTVLHTK